eukprot:scaffold654_cov274-Pinguiococcus_pyrenoidosus.AAC.3
MEYLDDTSTSARKGARLCLVDALLVVDLIPVSFVSITDRRLIESRRLRVVDMCLLLLDPPDPLQQDLEGVAPTLLRCGRRLTTAIPKQTHRADQGVQHQGCGVLRNMAATVPSIRQERMSTGGCEALLDVMKEYLSDREIQLQGCAALWNLAQGETSLEQMMSSGAGESIVIRYGERD